jgi:hypothetical protein
VKMGIGEYAVAARVGCGCDCVEASRRSRP